MQVLLATSTGFLQLRKFPGEILGKFQEIFIDIYSTRNIHSAYSEWIFVVLIVNLNYKQLEYHNDPVYQNFCHLKTSF